MSQAKSDVVGRTNNWGGPSSAEENVGDHQRHKKVQTLILAFQVEVEKWKRIHLDTVILSLPPSSRSGTSIILTSHSMEECEALCDRFIAIITDVKILLV